MGGIIAVTAVLNIGGGGGGGRKLVHNTSDTLVTGMGGCSVAAETIGLKMMTMRICYPR